MTADGGYGPWAPGLDASERAARLRAMRALVLVFCGPKHPLGRALRAAEAGDSKALATALAEIDRLPSLPRRRLLSTFAAIHRPEFCQSKKKGE